MGFFGIFPPGGATAGLEGPSATIPWILSPFFPRREKLPTSLDPNGRDADATFTDKEEEVRWALCSLSCSRGSLCQLG